MTISYEIQDAALQRELSRVIARARDQRLPLRQAAMILMRSVDQNFRSGGRPSWKPLSPRTIARRRKGSSRPLMDTGQHIKNTITATSDANSARVAPGPGPIPRVHQFGFRGTVTQNVRAHSRRTRTGRTSRVRAFSRRLRMNIPARPYLMIQEEDKERIIAGFVAHNFGGGR